MRKRIAFLIFGLSLLLPACQGAATAPASQPTFTATAVKQAEDLAAATATVETPSVTEAQPGTALPVQASGAATCTSVSQQPTPNPTQQSLFPPVGEKDWVEGAGNAAVTFFEYSDFQ